MLEWLKAKLLPYSVVMSLERTCSKQPVRIVATDVMGEWDVPAAATIADFQRVFSCLQRLFRVNHDFKPTICHPLDVERHRLLIAQSFDAWILHHLGVDVVAVGS